MKQSQNNRGLKDSWRNKIPCNLWEHCRIKQFNQYWVVGVGLFFFRTSADSAALVLTESCVTTRWCLLNNLRGLIHEYNMWVGESAFYDCIPVQNWIATVIKQWLDYAHHNRIFYNLNHILYCTIKHFDKILKKYKK